MSLEPFELDQYILIQSLEQIANYHQNVDNFAYKNLICINSDKPEIIFNRVISCAPEVYRFFNELTDLQKSFLVPKINIYKKQLNKEKKLEYKSIHFSSFFDTDEFLKFAATPESFNINNKRGDGAGIKSISITDRSDRPSDIHITCKLNLFFDNITALMNSGIMSLVTTPEVRTTNSAPDFRIKLVIGWQTPIDSSQLVFTPEQIDIIEKSNIIYLLELVTHTLSFRENGSVDLSIEYQGAIERFFGSNSQADILNPTFDLSGADIKVSRVKTILRQTPTGEADIQPVEIGTETTVTSPSIDKFTQYTKTLIQHAAIEEQLKQIYEKDKNNEEPDSIKAKQLTKDEKTEELERQEKELAQKIEELENFAIKEKYAKLLTTIWESNRLFNMKVTSGFMDVLVKLNSDADRSLYTTFIKNFKGINGPFVTAPSDVSKNQLYSEDPLGISYLKNANQDKEDIEKAAEKAIEAAKEQSSYQFSKISNKGKTREQREKEFAAGGNTGLSYRYDGSKLIPYITLGDIINTAVGFIPNKEDINIILGPCKIGKFVINLAHIPISIVNFSIWFSNNVVRKVKKHYFLWDFLQDIIRDLVTTNLTHGKLYGEDKDSSLTVGISTTISDRQLFPGQQYKDDKLVNYLSRNISNTDQIYQYLILYVYDYQLSKRYGDLEQDIKDGIYHYSIGKNKGIIKNIELNKVDFPKYRDMLMTKDSLNGPGNILRQHYNITMKTVGNPLFLNGGTFYFDASYLGLLGAVATDSIGVSGYFLTTGIEISLSSEGGYETVINGTWNAQKKSVIADVARNSIQGMVKSLSSKSLGEKLKDDIKGIKF